MPRLDPVTKAALPVRSQGEPSIAAGLTDVGATLVLNGLDPVRLEATRAASAVRFGDHRVAARAFDIVDEDVVAGAVASVESEVGGLHTICGSDPHYRRGRGRRDRVVGSHRGLASAIRDTTRGGTVVVVGLLPIGDQPVPSRAPSPGNCA
ncbi:hypothetical protein [Streptomyces sp. NPDC008137]|uniref:hypothetical protein n=1 Tax=Streptomyces sp. NPDC008137 TaxID=3364813 RepID=UPI0036ED8D74